MTTCEYNQPLDLCEGVRVEFVDAGHLLGSASILVTATEGGVTKQIGLFRRHRQRGPAHHPGPHLPSPARTTW